MLRGPAPVIICPARSIEGMRVPKEWAGPLEEGQLLLVSPFPEKERRVTHTTALARNSFAAAIARRVFVAHAAPGGNTEELGRQVAEWGKPLLTLEGAENANLFELGADVVEPFSGQQK